jgi:nicotinamide-nucleotide amidase
LLAVGDELLEGRYADSNSAELARLLGELGVEVARIAVEGDDERTLAARIVELCAAHELVIATGGLGPTLDDITREAAARAAGVELVDDECARADLGAWFERRGVPMPQINLRQIRIPRGSTLVRNPVGTAPGFALPIGHALFVSLPGPPHEMRHVWDESVRALVAARLAAPLGRARLYLFGLSESRFAEIAGARMQRGADPEIGVTASDGRLSVLVTARVRGIGDAAAELDARARAAADALAAELAPHVYSRDEGRLELLVARELAARGAKVAVAESCTGGLLAGALTSVPGISASFERGWIVYANAAKTSELGVPAELIAKHGAVSAEVAEALASGAAARAGAQLALSTTGIAGPSEGSAEKPVGTVWFGVHWRGTTRTQLLRFPPGDRERVRRCATNAALHLALTALRGSS